ncbi:uncharacterized protein VTP21DRAFT_8301 [Calcarisporiella thermophila]|uniref:uncharacterized protein n=1 Tax=Calcarisporiella thermophila TaxID=911321 RepID=UPI0037437A91
MPANITNTSLPPSRTTTKHLKPCKSTGDLAAYRHVIAQLTANAPKPYGTIPPLKKRKKKKAKDEDAHRQVQLDGITAPLAVSIPPGTDTNDEDTRSSPPTPPKSKRLQVDDVINVAPFDITCVPGTTAPLSIKLKSISLFSHFFAPPLDMLSSRPPTPANGCKMKVLDTAQALITRLEDARNILRKHFPDRLIGPELKHPTARPLQRLLCYDPSVRDVRSNPNFLRMMAGELNMIRAHKLASPLRPRALLPKRRDGYCKGRPSKRREAIIFDDEP